MGRQIILVEEARVDEDLPQLEEPAVLGLPGEGLQVLCLQPWITAPYEPEGVPVGHEPGGEAMVSTEGLQECGRSEDLDRGSGHEGGVLAMLVDQAAGGILHSVDAHGCADQVFVPQDCIHCRRQVGLGFPEPVGFLGLFGLDWLNGFYGHYGLYGIDLVGFSVLQRFVIQGERGQLSAGPGIVGARLCGCGE